MLIKEKESHIGIDIKEGAIHGYHSTRIHLQRFIQRKYKVSDLAFSQLTEQFIYDFRQYFVGECGFHECTFYNAATFLKTVCRLAYREGLADTLLFNKAKISKGDNKLPKALDREALDKLSPPLRGLRGGNGNGKRHFPFACYALCLFTFIFPPFIVIL